MAKTDRNGTKGTDGTTGNVGGDGRRGQGRAGGVDLEAFFEAGRDHPARPDTAMLARFGAVAEAEAAAHGRLRRTAAQAAGPSRKRLLAVLRDAVGGWPALAGLAMTACAGVWIGIAPPDGLAEPVVAFWTGDAALGMALEPASGFGALMAEG